MTALHGRASYSEEQLLASARTHLARSPGCTLAPSRVTVATELARKIDTAGAVMVLGGGAGGDAGGSGGIGIGEGAGDGGSLGGLGGGDGGGGE